MITSTHFSPFPTEEESQDFQRFVHFFGLQERAGFRVIFWAAHALLFFMSTWIFEDFPMGDGLSPFISWPFVSLYALPAACALLTLYYACQWYDCRIECRPIIAGISCSAWMIAEALETQHDPHETLSPSTAEALGALAFRQMMGSVP